MQENPKQYTMFELYPKTNDIWYWDNVVSCPNELISFIEELNDQSESHSYLTKWKDWSASDDDKHIYGKTKNVIKSQLNKNIDKKVYQKSLYIINSLNMALEMCTERYIKHHGLDQSKYKLDNEILNLRIWSPGYGMGPHADGQDGNYNLAFTLVMYLNDDYEGGEIMFPNHNVKIKPKAGSLIMFPATKEFVHQVEPIISGQRYTTGASVLMA